MKKHTLFLLAALVLALSGFSQNGFSGESALSTLLSICEQKGVVTPEQAGALRKQMAAEESARAGREADLEDKFKALILWERELAARQKALLEWEEGLGAPVRSPDSPQAPPAGVFPTEEALEAMEQNPGENTALLSALLDDTRPETPWRIWYKNGFCLGDPGYSSLCLGALLQADYRYLDHQDAETAQNRFDIRRAKLILSGKLVERFSYRFAYEFEGANSRRLLDAWAGANLADPLSLRVGQFKEPYGLEWSSTDKNLWFAERSMGCALTPGRDVGVMAHGSAWRERIAYGVGIFNGSGPDGSSGGYVDDPQVGGRLVIAPFKNTRHGLLENLQVGGSATYARMDRSDVEITARTTAGTEFFDISSNAKFHIVNDAGSMRRNALEAAWAAGPVALCGEYFHVLYEDVVTSEGPFDLDLKDWYVACLVMLTGEEPRFRKGNIAALAPRRGITHNGWGALGASLRYDKFYAGPSVYEKLIQEGDSVRDADAFTAAVMWLPESNVRLMLDWTRTWFGSPLKVGRDPVKNTAEYTRQEDVVTGRFQLGF